MAAGGAALSAGAGAVASAASTLFSTVTGSGDGVASGAPSGVPRSYNNTGTRPKRKVFYFLKIFCIFRLMWIMVLVAFRVLGTVFVITISFSGFT